MSLDLTFTDLFCGAGGSSIGAVDAGARLRMAANHWRLAIETHATNFPDADHDCADVSQVDPRRYPGTDILLASPECTHHSQARSRKHTPNLFDPLGDPTQERSRATMWDVPRFAEQHQYQAVIVENVVEARKWQPFPAWLHAMETMGYRHRTVFLNSMVARPTPQSRDRMYVVFTREGNPAPDLAITALSWCEACDELVEAVQAWKRPERPWGKYRQQYVYACPKCSAQAWPLVHPALDAIDWELPAQRICDRARPLSPKTMRRVELGWDRFVKPFLLQVYGNTYERPNGYLRAWPAEHPAPTQMTEALHGLVVPVHGRQGTNSTPTWWPWPTQTGRAEQGLLVPYITELRGGGSGARSAGEPLATVTAAGNHHGLVLPFVVKNYGDGEDPSMVKLPADEPFGTVTTQDHHSIVTAPFSHERTRVEPAGSVEECGFRMLEPHEVGAAMAFPESYQVLGSKRDRVRQYGNAVTPPASTLLVQRVIESLAP